ncbi:hypothetical protein O7635_01290 [Asanoa sp. WMMD1127]|uniref:hypothetical protein n=1 Tax=Asanoa sp. WMMD1127 TaxID=3016107 RepID=UPI002416FF81|nr:hypothetical protein [Asanoa sp. WMMD1127]MDG4820486.1 hypothetical protein [Asanoa sp. WMMD1127]
MTSSWLADRFGSHAEAVVREVPAAIAAAVVRQMDAHAAAGLHTLHAFGGAWPAQHEELVRRLAPLDGAEIVHPRGSAMHLVLLNGCLLVPFRYAEDSSSLTDPRVARKLNKTRRELLGQFGSDAGPAQPTLSDVLFPPAAAGEAEPRLLGDAEPAAIVLVVFAANEQSGLLKVGLADAALAEGELLWRHVEWLPLPGDEKPVAVGEAPRMARFDDAPLPIPSLDPVPLPRTADE